MSANVLPPIHADEGVTTEDDGSPLVLLSESCLDDKLDLSSALESSVGPVPELLVEDELVGGMDLSALVSW